MQSVAAWVKDFWGLIAAVAGICGAAYKYLVAPYLKRRKAREERLDAVLKEQTDTLKELKSSLNELARDVGYLQHDRLVQGHDYFMKKGFIPEHDRQNLIAMYDRYLERGRNSLFKSYRDDLLSLPPAPDIGWGKRSREGST